MSLTANVTSGLRRTRFTFHALASVVNA